jgi:hypothetical protein
MNGRQKQCRENANDRDDHKHLDEREASRKGSGVARLMGIGTQHGLSPPQFSSRHVPALRNEAF